MSLRGAQLRSAFNALREAFGGRCLTCSSVEELEFAHLKPTSLSGRGRGKQNRYWDIKRHPECFLLLCRDCHFELDQGNLEVAL